MHEQKKLPKRSISWRCRVFVAALTFVMCGCGKKEASNVEKKTGKSEPRFVDGSTLVSAKLPEIKINVADEFQFVGSFPFEILGNSNEYPEQYRDRAVASGERFVFVKAEGKKVEKLFVVQFEGFLPDNKFIYNYDFSKAMQLGSNRYRHNLWFYDSQKNAKQNPGNEGAKTRNFLIDKGYILEDEFMMSRFVGLASPDRKNEIIIFYIEMLRGQLKQPLAEFEKLSKEDRSRIRKEFYERSKLSFSIKE